jgi:hypothetical protein
MAALPKIVEEIVSGVSKKLYREVKLPFKLT